MVKADYMTEGTAEDFVKWYFDDPYMTLEKARKLGSEPFYCSSCGAYDFPHWEMGRLSDYSFNRKNQIEAPHG